MMKTDLAERYVYAVSRQLPFKQRADVELELHGLIEDMLEARCGEAEPAEADLRAVLEALGPPGKLALGYLPQGGRALIDGPSFGLYKYVLRIVLLCVALGVTVAGLVAFIANPGLAGPWYAPVLEWLGSLVSGGVYGFAVLTLIFALFQRLGRPITGSFSLDELPEVPGEKERIGRAGPVLGIVFAVLFCVVFLAAPGVLLTLVDGVIYPVFNQDLLRYRWPIILLLGLLGVAYSSFELYEGRRTRRLAVVSVLDNLLSILLVCLLFGGANVLNPQLVQAMDRVLGNGPEEAFLNGVMQGANYWLMALVVFALLLDSATTIWDTVRHRRV